VSVAIKDKIWSNMKEKIKFLAGVEDVVKNAMFINMGRLFHKWKSTEYELREEGFGAKTYG
jgi:hypothetical protein